MAYFENTLEDKQKLDLIQNPKEGLLYSENCYNSLLFNILYFWNRKKEKNFINYSLLFIKRCRTHKDYSFD